MHRKIGFEIRTLGILMKRKVEESPVFAGTDGLTIMHFWIIGYLMQHDPENAIYQKDIEQAFRIRRSTVANVMKLMEKNELIEKDAVDDDGRLRRISLTAKAKILHDGIVAEMDRINGEMVTDISAAELECFYRVIDKIKANLQ